MQRADVKANLLKVNRALKEMETSEEDVPCYKTKDKYLPNVGYIHDIDNIPDLVKAHAKVLRLSQSDFQKSVNSLNLTAEETELIPSTVKIMGFSPTVWFNDINTKLWELRKAAQFVKLQNARFALDKHLSEDDKFELDTAGVDDVLANL
jgi:hypothetical protein